MTREEAIEMLKSKMDGHTDTSYEWAETVRMAIKALEQETKTGRWIKRESEIVLFECSVCKDGYIDQPTCMGKPMFKYCPNCGAKMEVEE